MSWAFRRSSPSKAKEFLSGSKHPERLWDPHSLLFNMQRLLFGGKKQPGLEFDHLTYLIPKSKMSGAIHLLPYASLRYEQG
jgi:hypothetical protein